MKNAQEELLAIDSPAHVQISAWEDKETFRIYGIKTKPIQITFDITSFEAIVRTLQEAGLEFIKRRISENELREIRLLARAVMEDLRLLWKIKEEIRLQERTAKKIIDRVMSKQ